jgi:hypothetical protein
MAEIKTTANSGSVDDFIAGVEDPVRRHDAGILRDLMQRVTGEPAVMWGGAIVGFGSFEYHTSSSTYPWLVVGFSPRKAYLSLYGLHGAYAEGDFEQTLGKHTVSKGCVYIKRLADTDLAALEQLVAAAMQRDPHSA